MSRIARTWTLGLRALVGIAMIVFGACTDAVEPVGPVPTTVTPQVGSVSFTALGQSEQLSVTVLDQSGASLSDVSLEWSSDRDGVASVSSAGLVSAIGNGTADVSVRAGSVVGHVTVTVAQEPVGLLLSVSDTALTALGDTVRLEATVRDSGGSEIVGAAVGWSALDTLVAKVDADGLVTAVADGTTVVAAVSGSAIGTATVDVAQQPAEIELSSSTLTFASLGDTTRVVASVRDALGSAVSGPSVTWTTSDTTVATVSSEGLVRAEGNGNAVIMATSDQATGSLAVTVRQMAGSIALAPDSIVFASPGDTASLALDVHDALGSPIVDPAVSWSSSDDAIATVDGYGTITAVAAGTVTISADADGNVAQSSVRVVPELTLTTSGPTTVSGEVATELGLSVRVEDPLGAGYAGTTVTWATSSGSGSVVSDAQTSSDGQGYASAVWRLGTTMGAQQASASIETWGQTVVLRFSATASPGAAISASLVADSILLSARGETAYLLPTYLDQYGNQTSDDGVAWLSRDPSVASVAPDGLVTGAGSGSTYVVASLGSPSDSILATVVMRGAITVTFDDGFVDAYDNGRPVFQEFGLRGNVAVNPAQVGYPAYMTKADLDEVNASGWSIVSHSMTHDSLTVISDGDLDWQLRASQAWIDAQGYQGSNVFVVPYHDWGDRERTAIAGYYEATRGTSADIVSPDSLVYWKPDNPYDLTGIEGPNLPFTTAAGRDRLRAILQRTMDEGRFVDVFFHHLDAADVDAFRQTLAVIDEFRERVLPYHELYPRYARTIF